MSRFLSFLLAVGLAAAAQHAQATCTQMTQAQIAASLVDNPDAAAVQLMSFQVTLPTSITIEPDLAIGGTIATGVSATQSGTTRFGICDPSGTLSWQTANTTATSISNVYATNIDGVGLKVTYVRPSGSTSDFPFTSSFGPSTTGGIVYMELRSGAYFQATLVKTAEIANNVNVTSGVIGTAIAQDGNTVIQISSNATNILVAPNCSVSSSTLNIDFGQFGPRSVTTSSGPSRPISFTMVCTGVTTPTSVTATLSGTPDTIDSSLISNAGSATHLAIQLKDVATGTVLAPNNTNSKLTQTPTGMESDFALTAQVLRVGTSDPTAGTISATATITLDVQ